MVIKRVLAEMSDRKDFVDMFLSEARVAAKLSHRNITQIFEMGAPRGATTSPWSWYWGAASRT